MSVGCVEGDSDAGEIGGSEGLGSSIDAAQGWNGRDVELATLKYFQLSLIAQLFSVVLQRQENIANLEKWCRRFDLLGLREGTNLSKIFRATGQIEQTPVHSCKVQTEGIKQVDKRVLFINGMNTSFEEAKGHLNYMKANAGNFSVQGIFNHSNGIGGDLLEIFGLNYAGIALVTAKLLIEEWTQFHNENKDNPHAKCLQITHSMGNILTKAALQRAPQEIRDRVIVVSIAPAVVIPEGLCYDSYHYASKNDVVHYGEDLYKLTLAAFRDEDEPGRKELLQQLAENKERIILLDLHPDAKGIDHDFESPTFGEKLNEHIQAYLRNR